jgi:hypothetical protein
MNKDKCKDCEEEATHYIESIDSLEDEGYCCKCFQYIMTED